MSRACSLTVLYLCAHKWAWQLEDFTALLDLLKPPADAATGSSHPLVDVASAGPRTWGVPKVCLCTLCLLSKGVGMLPAPLTPPCSWGMVASPLFCYLPSLRKMVALGQAPSPLLQESSPGACLGSALVRHVQDMLADELPVLQRGWGHRKGADRL